MDKVSVVILTKNEEDNILDCIESLKSFDEIIVIDDYSEDRTEEVIRRINLPSIKYYRRHLDKDFSAQRNFALSKAKNEWVLFVDADERVSANLRKSIVELSETDTNGFYIQRRDIIWGRQLKHGETGNIKFLRLGRKDKGKWRGKVHEEWDIKGSVGMLSGELIHYSHPTVREFLAEISFYSTLRAKELFDKRQKVSTLDIILYPKAKFFLNYIVKLGFLDGIPGLVMAVTMSLHSYLVRAKLWLLYKSS
jgi:glycosyltransferase involved in cell wall biosynthesis